METTSGVLAHDPAADLALLKRSKASVGIDQILDFGPWWYAPLFATGIGGMTLFNQPSAGDWSFAYAAVGLLSLLALGTHDFRRRKVRQRTSWRTFTLSIPIVLGAIVLIALWGTAVSTMGYERFVPGPALGAWVLTTGFLLAVRAALHRLRARRGPTG